MSYGKWLTDTLEDTARALYVRVIQLVVVALVFGALIGGAVMWAIPNA